MQFKFLREDFIPQLFLVIMICFLTDLKKKPYDTFQKQYFKNKSQLTVWYI
jgi:hypothetical protein